MARVSTFHADAATPRKRALNTKMLQRRNGKLTIAVKVEIDTITLLEKRPDDQATAESMEVDRTAASGERSETSRLTLKC